MPWHCCSAITVVWVGSNGFGSGWGIPLLLDQSVSIFMPKIPPTRPHERQFWQRHSIGLNVRHAVILPELVISWLNESQLLPKGARGSNVLKLGAVKMVHWSVHGPSLFSGYFAVRFFEFGKKRNKLQET
jgi:hypothetical protein